MPISLYTKKHVYNKLWVWIWLCGLLCFVHWLP